MSDPKPRILQAPAEGPRESGVGKRPAVRPELTDAAEGDREQIERELDRKVPAAPKES